MKQTTILADDNLISSVRVKLDKHKIYITYKEADTKHWPNTDNLWNAKYIKQPKTDPGVFSKHVKSVKGDIGNYL